MFVWIGVMQLYIGFREQFQICWVYLLLLWLCVVDGGGLDGQGENCLYGFGVWEMGVYGCWVFFINGCGYLLRIVC